MSEPLAPDLQAVLDNVVATVLSLFGPARSSIFLVEDGAYRRVAPSGASQNDEWRPLAEDSIPAHVIRERQPICIEDIQSLDADGYAKNARAAGVRTTTAVPLLSQGSAIGALCILHRELHPLSEAERRAVQIFADFAATAIERSRLSDEIDHRNRELAEALEQQTPTGLDIHLGR